MHFTHQKTQSISPEQKYANSPLLALIFLRSVSFPLDYFEIDFPFFLNWVQHMQSSSLLAYPLHPWTTVMLGQYLRLSIPSATQNASNQEHFIVMQFFPACYFIFSSLKTKVAFLFTIPLVTYLYLVNARRCWWKVHNGTSVICQMMMV